VRNMTRAKIRMAMPMREPTAIPAIVPPDRLDDDDDVVSGGGDEVDCVEVGVAELNPVGLWTAENDDITDGDDVG
jgi:hypothetical protein